MSNIKFHPWVGKQYHKGFNGKRLLVLGESHYMEDPSEMTTAMTINVIEDLINPLSEHEGYKNTYTKFERALAGRELSATEKVSVWHSVAFYNYVQSPISGPRMSPTSSDFESSELAFFEVLETLQPEYIIAWGARLYENLPPKGRRLHVLRTPDGKDIEVWGYPTKNGKVIPLLPITHPSTAFIPSYWHEVISQFMTNI